MDDLSRRIASLSPEKRKMLAAKIRKNATTHMAPQAKVSEPLVLSFGQQRLWFLDQWEPQSTLYTIAKGQRLTGWLDVAALEQSIQALVDRHETLRTTFIDVQGEPRQVIAPHLSLPLKQIDLSSMAEEQERGASLGWTMQQEARLPFDLQQGPLFRATLMRVGQQEHVLVLAMHHIISDGWSMDVLIQELTTLYEAFCEGKPSPLAPLLVQYADFALWQRQWLQGPTLEHQLAYWRQQLADAPTRLELSTEFPRPPHQSFHGAEIYFKLSLSLSRALVELSRRENATLFMVLLAAFQVLLGRYSGQEDLVIGTPIANRSRTELEGLVGFFVNTLVLRTNLGGHPNFRTLLRRVREVALGAYAHQDVPFEKLVEELHPTRDLSRNPLFQVMFSLQHALTEPASLPHLTIQPLEIESQTAKFDVGLFVQEGPEGLRGDIQYNTALFEPATIERMVGHLQTLLEAIVAHPEQPITTLPLLTEREYRQIVLEWNATQQEDPATRCIHQLFQDRVRRSPQAPAVVCEGVTLTYEALNQRANQVAHAIRRYGVCPGVLVGLCMQRSLEMLISLLAILKAGGAYVPLDPSYPTERLAFMVHDAQVPLLLTLSRHRSLAEALGGPATQVLCLDTIGEALDQEDTKDLTDELVPEHLMYVIYTSGSTGQPKGVMNTHRGLCNRLCWMQQTYQLTPSDRVLQKAPASFDVSVWELFWPLSTGACLVLARPDGQKDAAYLAATIREEAITVLHFVPSLLQLYLEEAMEPPRQHGSPLRLVICSGEALRYEVQERFFARMNAALHNLYGPTEAAIDVTFWPCEPGERQGKVPIGSPIANTQMYVLDAQLQPVAVGVVDWLGATSTGWISRRNVFCQIPLGKKLVDGCTEREMWGGIGRTEP